MCAQLRTYLTAIVVEEYRLYSSVSFGSPGSGSVIVNCLYGSGSFHKLAKKFRKPLISTVLWLLFDLLSLKTGVNVPTVSVPHQWCDLFYRLLHSYTRHIERVVRGGRDTFSKCTGLRLCWRSPRQLRVPGHAGRVTLSRRPPPL